MDTVQELIERMQAALQYPADDTHATTIVILIIIAATVFVALILITLALPEKGRSHPESDEQADDDLDGATNGVMSDLRPHTHSPDS